MIVDRGVPIRVSDGTTLRANVFLPSTVAPVVIRTTQPFTTHGLRVPDPQFWPMALRCGGSGVARSPHASEPPAPGCPMFGEGASNRYACCRFPGHRHGTRVLGVIANAAARISYDWNAASS